MLTFLVSAAIAAILLFVHGPRAAAAVDAGAAVSTVAPILAPVAPDPGTSPTAFIDASADWAMTNKRMPRAISKAGILRRNEIKHDSL